MIIGVAAGSNADFTVGFIPPNGVLVSGPTWTTTDTTGLIVLGPALSNPSDVRFNASVGVGYTLPTFIITVQGNNSQGLVSADFVIPVPTAAPVDVTDFSLDQDPVAGKK